MKKILITGGTGYIGSHTLLELARTGEYEIVVFDNLKNGHREAIDLINKETGARVELVEGDLLNYSQIEKVLAENEFHSVIHFAALIEAGVSVSYPVRFFENNVSGSLNLFKAMQAHGVKKIVFSSTAAVYGSLTNTAITEISPLSPENPYATSKLVVEQVLKSFTDANMAEGEEINSVVLRYFNAAGSDPDLILGQDYPNPTHLITVAIEAALGIREKLTVFGKDYPTPDGTCVRDYIHVADLAHAHVLALNFLADHKGQEIFNLGTGTGTSNLEVVQKLEDIHGKFTYELGERRPGDPETLFADSSKAKEILGWEAKYTVDDAIKQAYEWKRTYPNGFEDKIKEE